MLSAILFVVGLLCGLGVALVLWAWHHLAAGWRSIPPLGFPPPLSAPLPPARDVDAPPEIPIVPPVERAQVELEELAARFREEHRS
mgnify:FL=1